MFFFFLEKFLTTKINSNVEEKHQFWFFRCNILQFTNLLKLLMFFFFWSAENKKKEEKKEKYGTEKRRKKIGKTKRRKKHSFVNLFGQVNSFPKTLSLQNLLDLKSLLELCCVFLNIKFKNYFLKKMFS